MKNIYISAITAIVFILTGCVDDGIYRPQDNYPEGETVLNLEAAFRPFTEGDLTRANIENGNGKVLNSIENLWIFVFDEDGMVLKEGDFPKKISFQDKDIVDEDRTNIDEENPIAETKTKSVRNIKLKLPFGNYYIVGVANLKGTPTGCATLDDLRKMKVNWNNTDISRNGEMIGYFVDVKSGNVGWPSSQDQFQTISVNRPGMTLKCWLRRCASKITIDIDGSGLEDKVTVYLKQAKIYDIPYDCTLGFGPKPVESETGAGLSPGTETYNHTPISNEENADGLYHTSSQFISYCEGNAVPSDDYHEWPSISKTNPKLMKDGEAIDFHAETADALYFYENMQPNLSEPKKSKVAKFNFDTGKMENEDKAGIPYGSYIEVEGYYISEAEGSKAQGNISFRFMLGKNVTDNFEAERNYHYMLTLKPKGSGNEADWHIEYHEKVFEVTTPKDVNYMGYFFEPNAAPYAGYENLGHKFNNQNTVTVTSYETGENGIKNKIPWRVSGYKENGESQFKTEKPEWITVTGGYLEEGGNSQDITFVAGMPVPDEIDIDANLKSNPKGIYNLASSSGARGAIENTANCYIVDGYGTFTLPLVYGNAITNYADNQKSYDHSYTPLQTNPKAPALEKFKNHLNKDITSPYITQHENCNPKSAVLVWEDADGLVTNISYDSGLYGQNNGKNIGGIQFDVPQGNIKQGNAVIAIMDQNDKIMWSWHIWVTNLNAKPTNKTEGLKETIKVTKSSPAVSWPSPSEYEFMSVNLGWCSEDMKIKYYPERSCEIRISTGEMSRTIKIVQKSHMAFPRGNNTYYQWGRKDPFWGLSVKETENKDILVDKTVYPSGVADEEGRPKRFYEDSRLPDGVFRKTTKALFDNTTVAAEGDNFNYATGNRLIQQPACWHNPPRIGNKNGDDEILKNHDGHQYSPLNPYDSKNQTYIDLWGQVTEDTWTYSADYKTVYDPTPVGYIVPHYNAFSSFSVTGQNINEGGGMTTTGILDSNAHQSEKWYEAALNNLPDYNGNNNYYKTYLMEFYTDLSKLQSIIFPENGYRDWDDKATIRSFGVTNTAHGYAWAKQLKDWTYNDSESAIIYDNIKIISGETSSYKYVYNYPPDAAFMFEFSRGNGLGLDKKVRPSNAFNTCDGLPIRPLKLPLTN